MLQAARTHLIIPEPSEDLITNEPWSIEFYADGLMDELFADIDEILDVSGNLPSQTLRHGSRTPLRSIEEISARDWYYKSGKSAPEYENLQTINVPQIILPNTLTRTGKTVPQVRKQQVGTVVVDKPGVVSKHRRTQRTLGKILIVGTAISVAIAGTIYLVQSGLLVLLTSRLTQQDIYIPQTQTQLPKVDIEAELVDYMLGALSIINKREATSNHKSGYPGLSHRFNSNSSALAVASNQSVGDLAPPLAANNTLPALNRSANVVERIYVPVYQAPSPMRYAPPPTPGAIATQPDAVKTALNTPQPPTKPANTNMIAAAVRPALKPVTVQTAPITVRQPSTPLPGLPVAPLRTASPTPSQQQAYLPSSVATVADHTLEGLLELGDKSAALFQIEGVSRRINMGESIGSSGWTLVDVSNGEVIVRRNGEVKSIYAGQKL
ncbi:hypothetical protein IQ243_09310 [Nostocales cyanobacterium LEGE 11386]|nr:hypothetical protein [Nostocales cyanobacterium LEGE 11386]